ncbi:hypothetical protein MMH89_01760 [Candidatus Comchoanobacter bicostacola]|uniref:Uncharacterized protein n=1 Tax=Candidatus Comchoanobacter bicostacola TaxID=2919598 RepID=A0ABY5DKV0_9GAMM|nr:hypothetical protein [Candidatus Comchoanobacter bicostacola]UTC24876.1 hypothetical protein MMH89_01760 [Candidatus Comchoanobacter bicostacola]
MDANIFAQIMGPVLCIIGIGMTTHKEIIQDAATDIIASSKNQLFASLSLVFIGSALISLFFNTPNADPMLLLGYATFLIGCVKMLFTSIWVQFINLIGDETYIKLVGLFLMSYGLVFIYFALSNNY